MYIFLILFTSAYFKVESANVNSTTIQFLKDPDAVLSSNNIFKPGFFSPPNSTDRFVGIWYTTISTSMEVVRVANRDNPLKDSSGVLKVSEDGNLHILDGQNSVLWSSNVSLQNGRNSSVAQLLDNGNLVLSSNIGGQTIWQSFEHLTDSWLPQTQLAVYYNTNKSGEVLRSWKIPSDPSVGNFTLGMAPSQTHPEGFIWDEHGRPYWRSGPWNGNFFAGIPSTFYAGLYNIFSLQNNTLNFLPQDPTFLYHFALIYDGVLVLMNRNNSNHKLETVWTSLQTACDVYGKCGSFGKCNPNNSPICSSLEEFEPSSSTEWRRGNWSRGCTRRTPLQCRTTRTGKEEDGFLRIQNVKVPDHAEWLSDPDDEDRCRRQCQAQCSCLAYSFYVATSRKSCNTKK